MTVEAITRKAGPYDYTSGASYPFYYKVFSETDVYVVVADEDGVETELVCETDYTVTLNDDQDNNPGGTIALLSEYEGCTVTIGSDVPYTQEIVITNKGGFYPNTLNKAHDKITVLCQQNREILDRCIKVGISSGTSADEYKSELEGLVDQSVSSAASAAASAQQAATDAATAVSTANEALEKAEAAVTTADEALALVPVEVAAEIEALNIPQIVSDDVDEKIEALDLDTQIYNEVVDAISGVTIPGLTPETIAGALGYTPYDAETNNKDFATSAEVAEAIAEIPGLTPETIAGALGYTPYDAETNNKDFATSAEVAEAISEIPVLTGATSAANGASGLVPAPAAGQQAHLLNGAGNWVSAPTVAMPVGAVYFQLAGQSAPADLFGGTWENISAQFAGQFFRAEGGNAAAFGSTQDGGIPDITGSVSTGHSLSLFSSFSGCFTTDGIYGGSQAGDSGSYSKGFAFYASNSNAAYNANEVRPYNTAIRIWKRIA